MKRKLYGLLVGINEYADSSVANLKGCVDDVGNIEYFLNGELEHLDVDVKVLKNQEATYAAVVKHFREHLALAGPNDIAFFHYSGHGSREPSAPEFKEFYPDGWDETLVCYDSRPSGKDLADKELAVLIQEISSKGTHVVVSLDSCHSGSGTRGVELTLRQTSPKTTSRSLDSYIDGYYVKHGTTIPESKHLLMASCSRYETAADSPKGGLYSEGLISVLNEIGTNINYADLFVKTRTRVNSAALQKAHQQSPQFEVVGNFNPYSRFLDGTPVTGRERFPVSMNATTKEWELECGALSGVNTDPEANIKLGLFDSRSAEGEPLATAIVKWVTASRCGLEVSLEASDKVYFAEFISMPGIPFPIFVELSFSAELVDKISALVKANGMMIVEKPEQAKYKISPKGDALAIKLCSNDEIITGIRSIGDDGLQYIFRELKKIIRWEKGLVLNNSRPKISPDDIDFFLTLQEPAGSAPASEPETEIMSFGKQIRAKLTATNHSTQNLFLMLLYYGSDYSVTPLHNDPLEKGLGPVTLWGDNKDDYFFLEEGLNESTERFRLVVSTEADIDFQLQQDGIAELGTIVDPTSTRGIGTLKKAEKIEHDWFIKKMDVRLRRKV